MPDPVIPADPSPPPVTPDTPPVTPPADTPWQAAIFNPDGSFVERWQEKLPADLESHRALLANFNSLGGLAKALSDNMTAARAKPAGLAIPPPDAPPEAKAAFEAELRKLYGVPESADGYKLEAPAGLPEGVAWSPETAATFAAKAHELGLNPQQAQALIQFDLDRVAEIQQAQKQEMEQVMASEREAMAKRWGPAVDQRLHQAQRLAVTLGLPNPAELFDPAHPLFAGVDMADAFVTMAERLGEKAIVPGAAVNNFDPRTQALHIMETDPAFRDPNHPNHRAVTERVTALYKQSTGGK